MTARMLLSNIASFGLQVTVLVARGRRARTRVPHRRAQSDARVLADAALRVPGASRSASHGTPWFLPLPVDADGDRLRRQRRAGRWHRHRTGGTPVRDVADRRSRADRACGRHRRARRCGWRSARTGCGACGETRVAARPAARQHPPARRSGSARGAALYVSDRVSGPITFGLLRPVIVFPPSVSAMPAHVQEAIAYHELLHVRRRDWLHEILEEAVRSVLWFHPAIWWLIGRIRLAREQVVDQAAIRLTDSRERYVESLLAVAAPARRHGIRTGIGISAAAPPEEARRPDSAGDHHDDATIDRFAHRQRRCAGSGRDVRGPVVPARSPGPDATPARGDPIQLVSGGEHLLHGELSRVSAPRRSNRRSRATSWSR